MKKVLIIGSRRSGTKNDPQVIARQLISEDVVTSLAYWEDLVFTISTGEVTITHNGVDIIASRPDLVIAVGWYKNGKDSIYRDVAFSVALVLEHAGITFWNSEMGRQRSTTKLSMMVQLALESLEVPRTIFSLDFSTIQAQHEFPFIAKAVAASRGNSNYLVKDDDDLSKVKQSDGHFIIQDFLPNDHDLRVICFNGLPQLVLRRARHPTADTHLNNTSQGGKAEWIKLTDIDAQLLTFVAKIAIVSRREMAGIDLIPDANSPFGYSCLEVNAVPQLTSGTDTDIKLTSFREVVRAL
jgi:glutathione synthase/RimK-type ligase-like ATP-grasp enzyme